MRETPREREGDSERGGGGEDSERETLREKEASERRETPRERGGREGNSERVRL